MKRYSIMALSALIGALALAACHHTQAKTSVAVARDACQMDALAEEHKTFTSRIETLDHEITERESEERWTILREKLRTYRGEVEASYRFVTSSCANYNMCMQANNFDDWRCRDLRQEWSESQKRFNELAIKLAEFERPIKVSSTPARPPRKHCDGNCPADRCNVEASVFSTSCDRRD